MPRTGNPSGLVARPRLLDQQGADSGRRALAMRPARRIGDGSPSTLKRVRDARKPAGSRRKWQQEAFTYAEILPPVGYVVHLTANTIASCDLKLVQRKPDGEIDPHPTDERAKRVLACLAGPSGGLKELLRRAGLLLTICGEGWLLGTPVNDGDKDQALFWEFVSPEEIKANDQGKYTRMPYGKGGEEIPLDAFIVRMHRSDARYSGLADCALRRCIDTCRELALLQQMVEGIISTRLPMGLLLLPDTLTWNSPLHRLDETAEGNTDDEVADEEDGPDFLDALIEHMGAPRTDPASAAGYVPLVILANREDIQAAKYLDLGRDLSDYASGIRSDLLAWLAVGLDVPPETLMGKGGLNHWTGSNVDSDMLYKHVQPPGELIASFLTDSYMRPVLHELEGMPVEEAATFSLVFDTSTIATRADEDERALRLWEAGLVSDKFVVERQGWDPDAATPDADERQRRILEKLLLMKSPSLKLTPAGLKLLGIDETLIEYVEVGTPDDGYDDRTREDGDTKDTPHDRTGDVGSPGQKPSEDPSGGKDDGNDEPEPRGPASNVRRHAAAQDRALLAERLSGVADGAWLRVMEVAGSKINSAARGKRPDIYERVRARERYTIPSGVSPTELASLGLRLERMVCGETWNELSNAAIRWFRGYLERQGSRNVDEAAHAGVLALVGGISDFSQVNFFSPPRNQPDGLRVPQDVILGALKAAEDVSRRARAAA